MKFCEKSRIYSDGSNARYSEKAKPPQQIANANSSKCSSNKHPLASNTAIANTLHIKHCNSTRLS